MIKGFIFGALTGAAAAFGVWYVASRKLQSQFESGATSLLEQARPGLRQEIRQAAMAEVVPRVQQTVRSTFSEYGITPEVARRVTRIIDAAGRLGL